MKLIGKMSVFGGPHDTGVSPDEGLALISAKDLHGTEFSHLFLATQPEGTTGLARRLDPQALYCAMRWDYQATPPSVLRHSLVRVTNGQGKSIVVQPADWGPNARTGRIIDLSPGAAEALGLKTDDLVTVELHPA